MVPFFEIPIFEKFKSYTNFTYRYIFQYFKHKIDMFKITSRSFIVFISILFLFHSCVECEPETNNTERKSILLEINDAANCYVNDDGNNYFSGAFTSIQDTLLFKVPMEIGAKYQIYFTHSEPIYDIQMYLLNSELDTISQARFYPPYLTEMFYVPAKTADYYIGLKLSDSYNQDLRFKLYFEKFKESNYSFCEKNWEGVGHWEKQNEKSIKYLSSDSKNIKWLRLLHSITPNSKISFIVRSETNTIPSVGFAFAQNYHLIERGQFQEKLPAEGSYFNFNDTTSFRMMYIRNGLSDGYIFASLDLENIDPKNGIKFEIVPADPTHKQVYINNNPTDYTLLTEYYSRFYLIIDDISQNDITFEDFKIEEM